MAGPQGPLLKSNRPRCRVCRCAEDNACLLEEPSGFTFTCHWVRVEGSTPPLCSACSGTEADMAEAIARGCRMLQQHTTAGIDMAVTIGKAALARRKRRQAENRT